MAKFKKNNLVYGLSGKFGEQMVFKQFNGETLLCEPGEPTGAPTEKQVAVRKRFSDAAIYGKVQMGDPEAKAYYEKFAKESRYSSAYVAATTDFLNPPKVVDTNITLYTGQIGDTIEIVAVDKFKVTSVSVSIQSVDGTVLESGEAVAKSESVWLYTCSAINAAVSGSRVIVKAMDRPGNSTIETKIVG